MKPTAPQQLPQKKEVGSKLFSDSIKIAALGHILDIFCGRTLSITVIYLSLSFCRSLNSSLTNDWITVYINFAHKFHSFMKVSQKVNLTAINPLSLLPPWLNPCPNDPPVFFASFLTNIKMNECLWVSAKDTAKFWEWFGHRDLQYSFSSGPDITLRSLHCSWQNLMCYPVSLTPVLVMYLI